MSFVSFRITFFPTPEEKEHFVKLQIKIFNEACKKRDCSTCKHDKIEYYKHIKNEYISPCFRRFCDLGIRDGIDIPNCDKYEQRELNIKELYNEN